MQYIVYKITNNITGHYYIGYHKTTTGNLDDGYMGSGRDLIKAMNKYGRENFSKEILQTFKTREKALEYEKKQVRQTDTSNYNVAPGGGAGVFTKKARKSVSKNLKNPKSDHSRKLRKIQKSPEYRKKHSDRMKKLHQNPEYRKRHLEGVRKAAAARAKKRKKPK